MVTPKPRAPAIFHCHYVREIPGVDPGARRASIIGPHLCRPVRPKSLSDLTAITRARGYTARINYYRATRTDVTGFTISRPDANAPRVQLAARVPRIDINPRRGRGFFNVPSHRRIFYLFPSAILMISRFRGVFFGMAIRRGGKFSTGRATTCCP